MASEITYVGPHDAVDIAETSPDGRATGRVLTVKRGETVAVPTHMVNGIDGREPDEKTGDPGTPGVGGLLDQKDNWVRPSKAKATTTTHEED